MKNILIIISLLAFGAMAQAQDVKTRVIDNAGSGEFKAVMASDKSLPTHTVFKPQDFSKFVGDDCGLSKREGWTFESKLRQGKDCCGEK